MFYVVLGFEEGCNPRLPEDGAFPWGSSVACVTEGAEHWKRRGMLVQETGKRSTEIR